MNCHQGGDTRVLQPGRDYYDFRPGTALDSTVAIFALPLSRESPPASPLLEHYSLMVLSKCYRSSGGRMSCLTCHDPHEQPGSDAASYYRKRCLGCHTETSCSLPLVARRRKAPPDDCAGCHMPKQSLTLISHSALTNHRIVAYEGEPYPEEAFHQTSPELPDLVHVNAVPGEGQALSPLVLLQAYGELMGSHPPYRERYLGLLDQLARTDPDNPVVLSGLAWRSIGKGTPESREEATRYLSRVVKLGAASAADYESLGDLLGRSGRTPEAITALQTAIRLYPYNDRLYKSLALLCISARHYSEAIAAMKKELAGVAGEHAALHDATPMNVTDEASVKAAVEFAVLTIRTLILVNGAAVIALLTFVGQVWANDQHNGSAMAKILFWPLLRNWDDIWTVQDDGTVRRGLHPFGFYIDTLPRAFLVTAAGVLLMALATWTARKLAGLEPNKDYKLIGAGGASQAGTAGMIAAHQVDAAVIQHSFATRDLHKRGPLGRQHIKAGGEALGQLTRWAALIELDLL